MASGKLYFEVVREKKHYLFTAHESLKAEELKKMIEGITEIPSVEQKLLKLTTGKDAIEIDYEKTLKDNGYTENNAQAFAPAQLALLLKDENVPMIAELSIPEPTEASSQE